MSFTRNIRQAQSHFWPTVRKSIDRRRVAFGALECLAGCPMPRAAFEETIWTLAKGHRLNTPEQTKVIEAALAWAKLYGDLDNPIVEDRTLYDSVQELCATFDPEDVDTVV